MNKKTRLGIVLMAYGLIGYIPTEIIAYQRVLPDSATIVPALAFVIGAIIFIFGGE